MCTNSKLQFQFLAMESHNLHKADSFKTVEAKQWPCALLDSHYELTQTELGHGTYGSVYKAISLTDGRQYALKKMEHIEDKNELGFPITTIRQVKLLQGLNHHNILNIKEVVYEKARNYRPPVIYLCLDLMECDLAELLKSDNYKMTPGKVQNILRQILTGLEYLHTFNISHRDIKPSNILINQSDILKIADFGLAKKLKKISTTKVVTMWYRAPELLLGVRSYTPKVDIWSVGCLAVELLLKKPLFQEQRNEAEMMEKIYELMGTPDHANWESELKEEGKYYEELKPRTSSEATLLSYLKEKTPEYQLEYELLDLIDKMLRLNHNYRLSAKECLSHSFFSLSYPEDRILTSSYLEFKRSEAEHGESMRKKVKL